MDSLERCRILCGISEDNAKKLGLLTVLLEKAREDIEAFCRDTFTIEGWDDFVENFSKFVDKWADKKKILLQRMANIYHGEVIPHVPVDTSRLVDSITIFGEGIPHDFVEVGTNVEYALYVNDGHVQHKRFLPADKLSVGGKAKYLKNRNQNGIMLKESYVNGSFFMEKGMQDAKPRLNRLVESFLQQIGREIEGGSL